jgi:CheY-like chemotaxis protein
MNTKVTQIIVCDDDLDINESIAISLKHEGYKVIKCFNGKEALSVLNKNHIDLIIMDIMMPGEDGIKTVERIRENSDVPIIFLKSDFESDEITQKAIDFSENLKLKTIIYELKDYADVDKLLSPFVFVIPLEWFVYYLAHYNGEDPGATRHIGKVRY